MTIRTSHAALALIQRPGEDGNPQFLAQWSDSWSMFSLVGGHVEPGESCRDCCLREVAEELELNPATDFGVARAPVRPSQTYTAWSRSAGVLTEYHVELFAVELLSAQAWENANRLTKNRWLSSAEILTMETADGLPISEQVRTVFQLFEVLP